MTTSHPSPDGLAEIAAEAWCRLARGAADRRTSFHRMQVATLGHQGWPELRTVILREVDEPARRVAFHTDRRSAKAAEIAADGRVALHLWDTRAELQLRLWGQAALETEGSAVEAAWSKLTTRQRDVYGAPHAPGAVLSAPDEADPPHAGADARGAFALVQVTIARFEWLQLRGAGHRRARFDWRKEWQGRWLAP
ncbi:pyridoxamine 5'-phosphate oxidase family protein [Limibaculum sp. M0105]|uniref:Pyridoxamine 5'-phosphate oxidase family protein n=1 Tax=Thermohalobaculum xanthum TaxID=2753746 RepID=A0A8J7M5R6_9RHOB|nr:pyridoxamine 5'-phosphate oxidase family protein [Thermohalobaculum xanthum]MBK0397959.1 pyridoxamine 5'-phosphate oxidase family protein [Thermohalobaculum xanthum]